MKDMYLNRVQLLLSLNSLKNLPIGMLIFLVKKYLSILSLYCEVVYKWWPLFSKLNFPLKTKRNERIL